MILSCPLICADSHDIVSFVGHTFFTCIAICTLNRSPHEANLGRRAAMNVSGSGTAMCQRVTSYYVSFMCVITPGNVHDMNNVRRNALSHALLLQDLCRKQLQSAPFRFTLDSDVFAVDALLTSWASLARAKPGGE